MSQLKLYFEAQNKKIGLEASATDFIPSQNLPLNDVKAIEKFIKNIKFKMDLRSSSYKCFLASMNDESEMKNC